MKSITSTSKISLTTDTGERFVGTPRAVVTAMRQTGLFVAHKTNSEYMRFVRRQTYAMHGGPFIRVRSCAEFLTDLATTGTITINRVS